MYIVSIFSVGVKNQFGRPKFSFQPISKYIFLWLALWIAPKWSSFRKNTYKFSTFMGKGVSGLKSGKFHFVFLTLPLWQQSNPQFIRLPFLALYLPVFISGSRSCCSSNLLSTSLRSTSEDFPESSWWFKKVRCCHKYCRDITHIGWNFVCHWLWIL